MPRFEAEKSQTAEKSLLDSTGSLASELVSRLKSISREELAETPPRDIEEIPDENSAADKNFRAPVPYRRIKPESTADAFLFDIKATVDIVVDLDEACRQQQVGEAWFANISQVPKQALSMSVQQVLKAKEILAVVPDERKAEAIRACFTGEISPMAPASILRTHPNATIYLDKNSASLLPSELREVGEHEVSSPASTWSQPKLETRC